MDEPTIVTLADPEACSLAAAERHTEPPRGGCQDLDVPHDFFTVVGVHGMEQALLDIAHHERRALSRQGHEMGLLELAHLDLPGLRVGDGAIVSHSTASANHASPAGSISVCPSKSRVRRARVARWN